MNGISVVEAGGCLRLEIGDRHMVVHQPDGKMKLSAIGYLVFQENRAVQ